VFFVSTVAGNMHHRSSLRVLIPCRLSDVVAKIITILEGRWGVLDNTRVTGRVVTIFKEDRGLIQSVVAIKVVVSDKELYTVAWSQSIELAKRCIYTSRVRKVMVNIN
jgi:hypothetical protein